MTLGEVSERAWDLSFQCTKCNNNRFIYVAEAIATWGKGTTLEELSKRTRCHEVRRVGQICLGRGSVMPLNPHAPRMGLG
jgi:hypothetical protein